MIDRNGLRCCLLLLFGSWGGGLLPGCGAVGPPIPPEDVGIAAKLLREERRAAEEERKGKIREQEQIPKDEPALPPLRPIGER